MPDPLERDMGELGATLRRSRPVPRPAFRGELKRRLAAAENVRPPRLRFLIAAYGGSGALLLAIALAGIAGLGPLSA